MEIDPLRRTWPERVGRALLYPYFAVAHRLEWWGVERVPAQGPAILAANHQSFLDPPAIGLAVNRRIVFLAARFYYSLPVLGQAMRLLQAVPVCEESPGHRPLGAMLEALEAGYLVGIFPEGVRSPDGLLGPPHEGVATLALRSGAPVVPVTIAGAHRAWPARRVLPRPARIKLYFGEPFSAQGPSTHSRRREVTREVMRRIAGGFTKLGCPTAARASRRRIAARSEG